MDNKDCNLIAKSIGGQAVIEGVMMRGKTNYCMAVRNIQTNEVLIENEDFKSISGESKFLKLPFVRGVIAFLDSMILGTKILIKSATLSGIETEDESKENTKFEKWLYKCFGEKLSDYLIYFSVFLSLIVSIFIFMVFPVWLTSFFIKPFSLNTWQISLFEGIIRLLIFLAYIFLISKVKDIQRVFMYHGAEHKTINCFEKGQELSVENVRKQTRIHKRCGTSFLIIVMLVSIIVFMFLKTDLVIYRIIYRILLVPLIAGISYEIIKQAGKSDNFLIKVLSFPGMQLQKITTSEPTDDMIETAILALKGVIEKED